jgi:pimeloyl-ACP methyl ester carboxylesterase
MTIELHHIRRGEGDPFLLIQGMAGTHLTWGDAFLDALAEDFDVIAIANRGVGTDLKIDQPFTIADLAEDAMGALDQLGVKHAHVLGISMGGMIAQEVAIRHPDRVRTLAIGCSYPGGVGSALTSPEVGQRLVASWSSGDAEQAIRTGWEANVSARFAADEDEYTAFRERALAERVPLELIMLQAQACGAHDTSARLHEITAPTLVMHGDRDEMLPVQNGRLIAEAIPDARLEVFEGVGHLFWLEDHERTVALIREHALEAAPAG